VDSRFSANGRTLGTLSAKTDTRAIVERAFENL
jgi:hypothetical protein